MKFNIDQAHAERKALVTKLRATRAQITTDQATNAKRDEKALKDEAAWFAKQGKGTK